jgi:hypothetical protein
MNYAGAEATGGGTAVAAAVEAAGMMTRGGAAAGGETLVYGTDDEDAVGGKENMEPTARVPICGADMTTRSSGALRRAAGDAGRNPALRPAKAALVTATAVLGGSMVLAAT